MFQKNILFFLVLISFLYFGIISSAFAKESESAEALYGLYKEAVYQIRVIDTRTGEKTSIGSGFRVAPDGAFITNYHVVSSYLEDQNQYRIEGLHESGKKTLLRVKNIDLIHDLAYLTSDLSAEEPMFTFRDAPLSNGERIFSMGNPHDLGLVIVEGTYNGLLEKSFYKKVLFSGALNPGMSGGPALDADGKIIGVNVATQGNDISYLVPVSHVRDLISDEIPYKMPPDKENGVENELFPTDEVLSRQFAKNEEIVMQQFMDKEWYSAPFASIQVPKNISSSLRCWGDSKKEDENQSYTESWVQCRNNDSIYVSPRFSTGRIAYYIYDLKSDQLTPYSFSQMYSDNFTAWGRASRSREDVSSYNCEEQFLRLGERNWKAVLCAHRYKKFPDFYDTFIIMALLGQEKSGNVIQVNLEGFSKEGSLAFIRKFLERVE